MVCVRDYALYGHVCCPLMEPSVGYMNRHRKVKGVMLIMHTECSKLFTIFFMHAGLIQ